MACSCERLQHVVTAENLQRETCLISSLPLDQGFCTLPCCPARHCERDGETGRRGDRETDREYFRIPSHPLTLTSAPQAGTASRFSCAWECKPQKRGSKGKDSRR